MDVRFALPFYYRGELFCWLQNTGHWPDIGGMVPGGFSAHATEVEQEGLRLPPVKLFKRGEMDREIYSIITSNIRDRRPAHRRHPRAGGGAEGGRAAADRAARPLRRRRRSRRRSREISRRASELMRSHIATIPDGVYRSEAFVDSDGVVNEPLKIALTVTKAGGELHFDFSGSSPPCRGPMNSVVATTYLRRLSRGAPHLSGHPAECRRLRAAEDRAARRAPSSTRAIRARSPAARRRCRSASPRRCSWRWCRPFPRR